MLKDPVRSSYPFSVKLDEKNHAILEKMYVFCSVVFDAKKGWVKIHLDDGNYGSPEYPVKY